MNQYQTQKVHLVFETCEAIELPMDDIKTFNFKGIKTDIRYQSDYGIEATQTCDSFYMLLDYDQINKIETMQITKDGKPMMLGERIITYNDIVDINLTINGESYDIYLPYSGEEFESNEWMKTKILSAKELFRPDFDSSHKYLEIKIEKEPSKNE